jgi:hypothetical protein
MEKFRWMGMAIAAVLFSVGLTACGGDDDVDEPVVDESGVVNNLKKLTCVKYYSKDDGDGHTYNMEYDATGKLSSVVVTEIYDGSVEHMNWSYSWSSGLITRDGWDKDKIYLDNNLVSEGEDEYYFYDSNNKIIRAKMNRGDNFQFTWSGERLVKVVEDDEEYQASISYSGKTCTGHCVVILDKAFEFCTEAELLYAHPELFGIYTSELPSKIEMTYTRTNYEYTCEYQYEFTKDNYVSGVTVTITSSDGDTYTDWCELTWE